ncbi:MAG: OmpA family protein [Candidatus Azobacteroides sp.]|nr:OmpA family protein [Candidatus Azobacteroides sp.]
MKTTLIVFGLILSSLIIFPTYAQQMYDHSHINDNWFIHIGGGGQALVGNNDKTEWSKKITVMPEVAVGKWFSPFWGVRIKGQGGSLHGFEEQKTFEQRDTHYNIHIDAMWNLANQIGGYSPSKIFNFAPYVGLGFAHRFQLANDAKIPQQEGVQSNYRDASNALSVNGGVQLGVRLSKRISLDFDLGASVIPDYFDRIVLHGDNEAILFASGGVTFLLGKNGFDLIEPASPLFVNELNEKINKLHIENERLSAELQQVNRQANNQPVIVPPSAISPVPQAAPEITVSPEINYIPNVVFFRLNSSKVEENQQISVFNVAEFIRDTGSKIKVVGYADKNTGTQAYNKLLSEKRAKTVANELMTKYKVPSDKIIVEWKGSEEQPYKENHWNRVVIMTPK